MQGRRAPPCGEFMGCEAERCELRRGASHLCSPRWRAVIDFGPVSAIDEGRAIFAAVGALALLPGTVGGLHRGLAKTTCPGISMEEKGD